MNIQMIELLGASLTLTKGEMSYLKQCDSFSEFLAPNFYSIQPFWCKRGRLFPLETNSGAPPRQVTAIGEAGLSRYSIQLCQLASDGYEVERSHNCTGFTHRALVSAGDSW